MDFDTRNSYRSVIEELARHSNLSEEAIAQAAIELCRNPPDAFQFRSIIRQTHVGFYLVDAGRSALEKRLNYQPGLRRPPAGLVPGAPHSHLPGEY